MAGSFGGTIKLQGESEYRKALKDITSNLRLMSSELKLTNTQFTNGDKSLRQTKASYESTNKAVQEQKDKITELRTALAKAEKEYGSNNEKVRTFKTQLNNAENELRKMETQTDKSTKELKEMKTGFDDAGNGALKFGDILKANIMSEAIIGGIKALGSAIKTIGSAFVDVGKQALNSYADYEQLIGGVETLFALSEEEIKDYAKVYGMSVDEVKANNELMGNSINNVLGYANSAYKTAGLSANEYMSTVTSFSASLLQSLGQNSFEASEYANRAVIDMADNANKMGTDIGMIQSAYQGFAKSNYTMLDNLKLGYGGTKTEMERLIYDASKMKDIQKELGVEVDASSMSFGNIVNAISVMQQSMGIAGTTAKEASTTISGSLSSMKSAWQNMLTGIADDSANFGQLINNLVESIVGKDGEGGVFNNILPRVEIIINGIVQLIMGLAPKLVEYLPTLLQTGMNLLQTLLDGMTSMLPQLMPLVQQIISSFTDFLVQNLPTIINVGVQLLISLINGIVSALPQLIPAIMQIINNLITVITENLPTILQLGIDVLFEFMKGIAEALPDLVPQIVNIIIKIMEVFNENFDTFLMLGIKIILGLIEGLIKSIPDILRNLPTIIMAIINFFTLSKFLTLGKTIISGLVNGLTTSVPNMLKEIPKIIGKIIKSFTSGEWKQVGKDIIKGICNGLTSMGDFIWEAIKNVGNSMLDGIRNFFGIKSPSRLMKDQVGTYLAEGIGVGFEDTMTDVSRDMANAIPTEFDTKINANVSSNMESSSISSYDNMVSAFKKALTDVKIVMNDREFGTFVEDTMNKVVYS